MSIQCYCDYESPEVYSSKIVKARKEYRCEECSAVIRKGDQYEYAFGVTDGYTYQPHTCLDCVDIRQFVKNNIPCFCWAHGNLFEDCDNIIEEAYAQAPDEVRGLWFGYQRLRIKARRKKQGRAQ
jgi:hypothetical protein